MEFFHSVLDLFSRLQPWHFFLLVFAGYFVENIFPPLPGDTMLVFSAYLFGVYQYHGDLVWLYVFSVGGAVLGFMLMVFLGGKLGRDYFVKRDLRYAPREFFAKVDRYFRRYGAWVILGNRLFFGMRPVIGLAAGISGMPRRRIALLNAVSAFVFNAAFMLLGVLIGENWPLIENILRKYTGLTVVMTLLLLLWLVWRILRKRKKT